MVAIWLVVGAMGTMPAGIVECAFGLEDRRQAEIEKLDAEIGELKLMKRGFEARAVRAEDQAERLQFGDRFVLETRKYFRIAEANRQKAARVQEEIDKLEKRKAELLAS